MFNRRAVLGGPSAGQQQRDISPSPSSQSPRSIQAHVVPPTADTVRQHEQDDEFDYAAAMLETARVFGEIPEKASV